MQNKKINKKIIVFYHGDCSDGFGGAWAAWKKFRNRADYVPLYREKPLPAGLKNKEIYFIDFTPNGAEAVRKLLRDNIRVTCIDHHISAKKNVFLTHRPLFAINHSGAVLAWQYFHPGKRIPMLLRYVEDRDIWKWKLPRAKEIAEYLDLFDYKFSDWDKLSKDLENDSRRREYARCGGYILRYKNKLVESAAKNADEIVLAGRRVYAANAPHDLASELCRALARRKPPFGATWDRQGGLIKVSLRSVGDFDVSRLAQKFGGGGHRHSAGFSFPAKKGFPWKFLK